MDLSSLNNKKRKAEDNGTGAPLSHLTLDDAYKLIASFTVDQLRSIVAASILDSTSVLAAVRSIADSDISERKLFIRGLGWDTNTETLRSVFAPFGEIKEAAVICDKATGKSKGYGFVTYEHVDGALLALKEPSKNINGRITVAQLASAGNTGPVAPAAVGAGPVVDVSQRKVFVGNVPQDMPSDRLLAVFGSFGEIEEGPLGLDKMTGKFKGYAMFVYKTVEGARAAISVPTRMVDGTQMVVKLANEGKKKPGVNDSKPTGVVAENKMPGEGYGTGFGNQFGGPGSGLPSYGGYGLPGPGGLGNHQMGSPLQSGQGPSPLGGPGAGGYGTGGGFGGGYGGSQFSGGPVSGSQFLGGPGSGSYGGLGNEMGSSLYNRLPPSSMGMMGAGGFSEGGPYSLSSLRHQSAGSPPGQRIPPGGGMYPAMPPYY